MERFKKILRKAVSEKTFKVSLVNGSVPQGTNQNEEIEFKEFGTTKEAWLQTIFNFLFQKDLDQINEGKPTQGILSIPNLGQVRLIGQRGANDFINLYLPPEGQGSFEQDWNELKQQESANGQFSELKNGPVDFSAPPENINSASNNAPQPEPFEPAVPVQHNGAAQNFSAPELAVNSPAEPDQIEGFDPAKTYHPGQAPSIPAGEGSPFVLSVQPDNPHQDLPSEDSAYAADSSLEVVSVSGVNEEDSEIFSQPQITPQPVPSIVEEQEAQQFASPSEMNRMEQFSGALNSGPKQSHKISYANEGDGSISQGANPIDKILIEMIKKGASDLHLLSGQPIIYRIDGSICRMESAALTPQDLKAFIQPIIPLTNQKEFSEISDTDFAYEIDSVGRFRVNVFRNNRGVAAVMRHIPATVLTAEQLKLPPVILKMCELHKGLVLVTGPTGSGKSTTLAAMIDLINKTRSEHLLTIEDPIEFVHKQQKCLVNQREVGRHTQSFARALKAALREDPDIVLIGEMRDLETVHIGIETAETGHLVFGTLHTTTAISTIDRIIDQFPADQQEQVRMMLSSSLKAVISQTLLKKKGGGRVAAHEILVMNDAVANMIREQKPQLIQSHMQTQKSEGNILLNESLMNLVANDTVSFEEAYLKSVDKKSFIEMCKRKGIRMALNDGSVLKAG